MSPGLFLAYQILPSTVAWLCTTYYIKHCWMTQKTHDNFKRLAVNELQGEASVAVISEDVEENSIQPNKTLSIKVDESMLQPQRTTTALSPRQLRLRNNMLTRVSYVVTSPVPMLAIGILILMVVFIFLNLVSIAALVCITAVLLVTILVVGNYWLGRPVWGREDGLESPKTREEHNESLADFFEELFQSIGTVMSKLCLLP